MSKHAIEAFTDTLAGELQRFGVTVSVIEPGNYASQIGNTAKRRMLARNYWKEDTRYPAERENMLVGLTKVTEGPDPLAVAEAALDIMRSETPKLRYMVVDKASQADTTIRRAALELLQLNQRQPHTQDIDRIVEIVREEQRKLDGEPVSKQ